MKKLAIISNILLITLITALACSINNETGINEDTLTVSDFDTLGLLHNDGLSYVKSNLDTETISSKSDYYDQIHSLNIEFIQQYDIPNNGNRDMYTEYLNKYSKFIDPDILSSEVFGIQYSSQQKVTDNPIEELLKPLVFNPFAYDLLNSFINDLEQNMIGRLSDNQVRKNLEGYISSYNKYGFKMDSPEGALLGSVFAISLHSLDWWENNPDAVSDSKLKVIPLWLLRDAIGAIIGGLQQYQEELDGGMGEHSGRRIAIGAVVGGLSASAGAIGAPDITIDPKDPFSDGK